MFPCNRQTNREDVKEGVDDQHPGARGWTAILETKGQPQGLKQMGMKF